MQKWMVWHVKVPNFFKADTRGPHGGKVHGAIPPAPLQVFVPQCLLQISARAWTCVVIIVPYSKAGYTLATKSTVTETGDKSATVADTVDFVADTVDSVAGFGDKSATTSTDSRGRHCRQLARHCRQYGQLCCRYGRLYCQCVRGQSDTVDFQQSRPH